MKRRTLLRLLIGSALSAWLILAAAVPPADAQENQAAPIIGFKPRSEDTASALSLIGAAVPWALFLAFSDEGGRSNAGDWLWYLSLAAMPVGPSLGHFYAGSNKRAWGGIGVRAGSITAFIVGVNLAFDGGFDSAHGGALPVILMIGGAATLIGSTVADVVDAHKSARRYNLRGRGLSMTVAPVLSPRTKALGLQAHISF